MAANRALGRIMHLPFMRAILDDDEDPELKPDRARASVLAELFLYDRETGELNTHHGFLLPLWFPSRRGAGAWMRKAVADILGSDPEVRPSERGYDLCIPGGEGESEDLHLRFTPVHFREAGAPLLEFAWPVLRGALIGLLIGLALIGASELFLWAGGLR